MPRGVPRIPEPREWVLTKRCAKCGETKPWARFGVERRWPDGTVRQVRSYCHSCEAARMRARAFASQCTASRSEYQRRWRGGRRPDDPLLPVGPFRIWLAAWLDREDEPVALMAARSGVHERRLRSILNGEQRAVSLSIVDRVMTSVGAHLSELEAVA